MARRLTVAKWCARGRSWVLTEQGAEGDGLFYAERASTALAFPMLLPGDAVAGLTLAARLSRYASYSRGIRLAKHPATALRHYTTYQACSTACLLDACWLACLPRVPNVVRLCAACAADDRACTFFKPSPPLSVFSASGRFLIRGDAGRMPDAGSPGRRAKAAGRLAGVAGAAAPSWQRGWRSLRCNARTACRCGRAACLCGAAAAGGISASAAHYRRVRRNAPRCFCCRALCRLACHRLFLRIAVFSISTSL